MSSGCSGRWLLLYVCMHVCMSRIELQLCNGIVVRQGFVIEMKAAV